MKKQLLLILMVFAIVNVTATTSSVITVGTGTGVDYTSLQAAVNAVSATGGEIHIVDGGNYTGAVFSGCAICTVTIINETSPYADVYITGASPAWTQSGGTTFFDGITFTTSTDDPTILITDGLLTLRNCTIIESATYNQSGIFITGGELDAGKDTPGDEGHNTFVVNAPGRAITNDNASSVANAVSNYWGGTDYNDVFGAIFGPGTINIDPWCNIDFTDCSFSTFGGPVTTIGTVSGCGTTVDVPITVETFNDVDAISLTLDYDDQVIAFLSFAAHPDFPGVSANEQNPGQLKIGWFGFGTPVSLPGPIDTLGIITFVYSGGTTTLQWNDSDPNWCEYSNANINGPYHDTPTSTYYINGGILVLDPPISGGDTTACQELPVTQTLTATATPVAPGNVIVWFDAAVGGNVVADPILDAPGTVTYYAANSDGVCTSDVRTPVTLQIDAKPAANIEYLDNPYCSIDGIATVTRTGVTGGTPGGTPGGTYFAYQPGLDIDPVTGDVNVGTSVPGTYTVGYVMPANGTCPSEVTTTPITIEQIPDATISYANTPFCYNDGPQAVTITGTQGGLFSYYSYPSLALNTISGEITLNGASLPGTYTVFYSFAATAACPQVNTSTTVEVLPEIFVSHTMTEETCIGFSDGTITLNVTGAAAPLTYAWAGPTTIGNVHDPVGLTAGTYAVTITDANNCEVIYNADVTTVLDVTPPVITCPADITQTADPGACDAIIAITPATATDDCGVDTVIGVRSDAALLTDPFPVGVTSIIWTAYDLAGNSADCVQTVEVTDDEDPVVTCPAVAASYLADQDECFAELTFAATATDNCGIDNIKYYIATIEITFPYQFPVGTTTVDVIATDLAGNTDDCNFDVVVVDDQDPVITCPTVATSYDTDLNQCYAELAFAATATDNCGIDHIKYYVGGLEITFPHQFPTGITTVEAVATDLSGNTDTCDFDVDVVDVEDPVITCPTVAASYDTDAGECYAELSFAATATDNCGIDHIKYYIGTTEITFPYQFIPGTTTVEAVATDYSGNTDACNFDVVVIDAESPVVTCPTVNPSYNIDAGQCYAELTFTATATDNCGIDHIKYYIGTTEIIFPYQFDIGTTTVTVIATDLSGNTDACNFDVVVVDDEDPVITCPTVAAYYDTDPGECYAELTFAATATDNCSIDHIKYYVGGVEITFPYQFPTGITTVEAVATDLSGNTDTCDFDVDVIDTEDPTIVCPIDVTVSADSGECSAALGIYMPTVSDNCGIASIVGERSDYPLGLTDPYPVVTTVVTWTVTDDAGNSAVCYHNITVTDDEDPVIICADDVKQVYSQYDCDAAVTLALPAVTDNCGIDTIIGVRSDMLGLNDPFPAGVTQVTWTVTDVNNNSSSCVQNIEITPVELIALYNFNNATQFPMAPDQVAGSINSYATSFEPFLQSTDGTATGSQAFINDNGSAGNRTLAMAQSDGTNARYFEFRVHGDTLYRYRDYQLYLQGRREANAATQIAVYYSFNGITFWPGDSVSLPTEDTWFEKVFDLSNHDTLNYSKNIYLRLYVRGSSHTSGPTKLDIDNFQLVAVNGPLARPDYVTVPMNGSVTVDVLTNDFYGCNGPAASMPIIGVDVASNGTSTKNPDGTFTYVPDPNYVGYDYFTYRICDGIGKCDTAIVHVQVVGYDFDLAAKVMLQGPYDPISGLMKDSLRSKGYIPTTEPYASAPYSTWFTHQGNGGGEVISNTAVLNVTGNDAIVDWVFIELRDKNDSAQIVETRAALIQRDGDIVDVDGVSPVTFSSLADNEYYVAIRHRNHLGVMTANLVTFSPTTPAVLNFTDGSVAEFNFGVVGGVDYTTLAQKDIDTGVRGLHAGNAEANNKVKYQGIGSDRNIILNQVLNYPANTFGEYNYNFAMGYFSGDINMDGQVKYQGAGNDANVLLNVILNYVPGATPSYDFMIEQLPVSSP